MKGNFRKWKASWNFFHDTKTSAGRVWMVLKLTFWCFGALKCDTTTNMAFNTERFKVLSVVKIRPEDGGICLPKGWYPTATLHGVAT